jgi:hypothetical protein
MTADIPDGTFDMFGSGSRRSAPAPAGLRICSPDRLRPADIPVRRVDRSAKPALLTRHRASDRRKPALSVEPLFHQGRLTVPRSLWRSRPLMPPPPPAVASTQDCLQARAGFTRPGDPPRDRPTATDATAGAARPWAHPYPVPRRPGVASDGLPAGPAVAAMPGRAGLGWTAPGSGTGRTGAGICPSR